MRSDVLASWLSNHSYTFVTVRLESGWWIDTFVSQRVPDERVQVARDTVRYDAALWWTPRKPEPMVDRTWLVEYDIALKAGVPPRELREKCRAQIEAMAEQQRREAA